jgi:hypothetical protein
VHKLPIYPIHVVPKESPEINEYSLFVFLNKFHTFGDCEFIGKCSCKTALQAGKM